MFTQLFKLSFQYLKISSKKGDLNRIVTWVILMVVLLVMLYFIWHYLVGKGFGGFDPMIENTTSKASSIEKELLG
ncbi:hypothetical protein DRJ25_04850 [Candidatus Woesearchaeota archaeon]|nr:MAG: hypothetical protein DRJ25_04850 [Candidatus Woesearchaeota archaeon]